jgi:molybdate/tungstate transport system permease protein
MSEFGAIVIIAYHPMTAPVLIYERFNQFGLSYARPAAVVFIAVALVVFILLRLISFRRRGIDDNYSPDNGNDA